MCCTCCLIKKQQSSSCCSCAWWEQRDKTGWGPGRQPEEFAAFLFVVCSSAGFNIALLEKNTQSQVIFSLAKWWKQKWCRLCFQFKVGDYRRHFRFNKERRYAQRCKAAFKDFQWHSLFVLLQQQPQCFFRSVKPDVTPKMAQMLEKPSWEAKQGLRILSGDIRIKLKWVVHLFLKLIQLQK